MRTNITASYDDAFGNLINLAYNVGYDMQISDDLQVRLKATKDSAYMPKITVDTDEDNGIVYFIPTLTFPKLDGWELDYDDIEYFIECWQDVSRFVTQLMEFQYNPNVAYE